MLQFVCVRGLTDLVSIDTISLVVKRYDEGSNISGNRGRRNTLGGSPPAQVRRGSSREREASAAGVAREPISTSRRRSNPQVVAPRRTKTVPMILSGPFAICDIKHRGDNNVTRSSA